MDKITITSFINILLRILYDKDFYLRNFLIFSAKYTE